ncbi:hypothetical protein PM082_007850 [Marasmius tenuissimus]|nr:hypothetical protein PM082_007850 [Marasmius tenuissimus]
MGHPKHRSGHWSGVTRHDHGLLDVQTVPPAGACRPMPSRRDGLALMLRANLSNVASDAMVDFEGKDGVTATLSILRQIPFLRPQAQRSISCLRIVINSWVCQKIRFTLNQQHSNFWVTAGLKNLSVGLDVVPQCNIRP